MRKSTPVKIASPNLYDSFLRRAYHSRMTNYTSLSAASVNEVLRLAPDTGAVFNRFGVDTCCGGGLPLDQAAREAGVPLDELLAAIAPMLPAGPAGASVE
jgi:regulator of cell morphogenesis and NO signaling